MSLCPICEKFKASESEVDLNDWRFDFLPSKKKRGIGFLAPKRHCENMFALTPKDWQSLKNAMNEVRELLTDCLSPDGLSIILNQGKAAGQKVEHIYFIFIPRFNNEMYAGDGAEKLIIADENIRTDNEAAEQFIQDLELYLS